MQWFLEFLGFREPPGAPVPPPPPRTNPLKPPKLHFFASRTETYLFVIFIALWTVPSLSSQRKFDWILLGFISLLVFWFLYSAYKKRRWRALREQAKATGYLHCPTCNHDLRGTRLKDSTDPITIPMKAAASDLVICPECGEEHRVKDLGEIWELP